MGETALFTLACPDVPNIFLVAWAMRRIIGKGRGSLSFSRSGPLACRNSIAWLDVKTAIAKG